MAKFIPFDQRCKETVNSRDQYVAGHFNPHGPRTIWRKKQGCGRKAGPSGYCWQHAPAREEWAKRMAANKRKRRSSSTRSAKTCE